MPGFVQTTIDWFRYYKIPDGKPANQFGLDAQARGKVQQKHTSDTIALTVSFRAKNKRKTLKHFSHEKLEII